MTFRISKEFSFSSSHQLHGLREGHPCGRVHGHNYVVKVTLSGEKLNGSGFLLDYNDLKPFGHWLDDELDHRHLNDVLNFQPSAENMAQYFAFMVENTVNVPEGVNISVSVSETPKTWATWEN
jgi:6-pyruvoyltetrahydropterin/6-carboxytetrahydropterin synthase